MSEGADTGERDTEIAALRAQARWLVREIEALRAELARRDAEIAALSARLVAEPGPAGDRGE